MSKYKNKLLIFIMMFLISLLYNTDYAHAETEKPINIDIECNGNTYKAKGLMVGYDNNRYVSLIDVLRILSGTNKEFEVLLKDGVINIYTKDYLDTLIADDINDEQSKILESLKDYLAYEDKPIGWSDSDRNSFSNTAISLNPIKFNNNDRRYYTIYTKLSDYLDCFVHICDLAMIFDMNIEYANGVYTINPELAMQPISPKELEADGYFLGVNSVLVGDATTGEVLYSYNDEMIYPIASTTKLMTYLLVADALKEGQIHLDDLITISEVSEDMSQTSDGFVPMKAGQKVSVDELMKAALIVSSNESGHALSEYVAGDEDAVVKLMNAKAAELKMTDTTFFNCNGLPVYSDSFVPAKKQNNMSSMDMFRLTTHILKTYPEIKDITSTKSTHLDILNKDIRNTNPLLYNMDEVTGLKTGTTNKSGACLITSLTANTDSSIHDIVVVLFGAEGSAERGRVSELMARYGKSVVEGNSPKLSDKNIYDIKVTLNANDIVNKIVNKAVALKKMR